MFSVAVDCSLEPDPPELVELPPYPHRPLYMLYQSYFPEMLILRRAFELSQLHILFFPLPTDFTEVDA
jgi:hypothetical protein